MRSSTVMDHTNIPACALYRHIGTVIVRLKMEVSTMLCWSRDVCPASGCPESMHRPSGCEQCARTRLNSKCCDCDSVHVDKSRPYRSSTARSRYVNVCAAVCLLLLVGGLTPQSSAAPRRSRSTMQRQKRAADTSENHLWSNPCDLNNLTTVNVPDPKTVAPKLIAQATSAYRSATKYKDTLALQLHSFQSFDELITQWVGNEWLRKFSFSAEVLPKDKTLYKEASEEQLESLMGNIDTVLPSMYKALKLIVAGLHAFSNGLNDNIIADEALKENTNQTMHDVRAVLCYFSDIMRARNLELIPLPESEVPVIPSDNMVTDGLLIYRDTLNYLEYLRQVFKKLYG
ncbi:uncharacterized protein LOC101739051 isoform X1 [Bombyx mori]|uniref:Uncharacterized protein n=2 Tax=Bombyx mori TaxID=7091 RepID=A0A8R1WPA9_BOMMO|nr:uncharacterized protein LOC101739051 isoform X1 [Bombyx mori]